MIAVANDAKGFQLWDTTTWQVRAQIEEWNFDECHFLSNGRTCCSLRTENHRYGICRLGKRLVTLWSASESSRTEESRLWLAPDEKTAVTVVSKRSMKMATNGGPTHGTRQRGEDARASNGKTPPGAKTVSRPMEHWWLGSTMRELSEFWEVATGRKQFEMRLPIAGDPEQGLSGCGWDPGGHNLSCLPRRRPDVAMRHSEQKDNHCG